MRCEPMLYLQLSEQVNFVLKITELFITLHSLYFIKDAHPRRRLGNKLPTEQLGNALMHFGESKWNWTLAMR